MNNQVKLIDESKILSALKKELEFCIKEKFNEKNTRFYLGRETVLMDIIRKIEAGEFASETPPVPTIKPGDRDWKKDMEWAQIISEAGEYKAWTEPLIYWLQKVMDLQSKHRIANEEIARIKCDYYTAKQRFHKQARELEEANRQANKLREAIETAINEKAAWGDPGNALDVVTRYLADTLDSLYPKEEDRGKTNL